MAGLPNNFDNATINELLDRIPISVINNVAPTLEPTQNLLHNYATYTYRITMGAQNLKDHTEITENGFTRGTPKITSMMMQSGGGHAVDGSCRDPIFKEDFYLGDLKMTTIIGQNAQTNGSNTVSLEFSIMEPYAVSLIERLLALAEKLGYKNYIDIPYIFKIEFIGYNDAGEQIGVIPQTTRYIPFKLTYMKFEVRAEGSIYECTAIPVNHMAFNQTVAQLPEGLEIAAGNIGEFFNGKATGETGNNTTGSLVETINAYHKKLTTSTGVDGQSTPARNFPDKIEIELDKRISDNFLQVGNLSNIGMLKEGYTGNVHMDPGKPTYGFQPSTSITKVIEEIIKNSTFYTNQIEEAERIDQANASEDFSRAEGRNVTNKNEEKKPFIHFKITSQYTMLQYDEKANRHAYKAKFIVTPFETAGHQNANLGRSEIENIAKEYNYLFTGKNQDILNLDIKFDLAFYNSMSTNTESAADGASSGGAKKVNGENTGDGTPNNKDKTTLTQVVYSPHAAIDNTGTSAKEDRKKLKASSVMKSIMQDSRGDMITLDLTILGDPAFIKQDDILYRTTNDTENAFTENGSIKQDNGDMYIRLKFNTTDDIDHDTGLRVEGRQIPNSSFTRNSSFDGFYRIITIDNIFQEGRFTQELVVIRTYVQDSDDTADDSDNNLASFDPASDPVNGVGSEDDCIPKTLSSSALVDEQRVRVDEVTSVPENLISPVEVNIDSIVNISTTPTIITDYIRGGR